MPNADTIREPSSGNGDHTLDSSRRAISRQKLIPHVLAPPASPDLANLSCERGIRSSAVQPDASVRVALSHTASHSGSSAVSEKRSQSLWTPATLTEKRKAVR